MSGTVRSKDIILYKFIARKILKNPCYKFLLTLKVRRCSKTNRFGNYSEVKYKNTRDY